MHGSDCALAKTDRPTKRVKIRSPFNVIWVVQIARRKYIASHFPQISPIFAPSRLMKRGVRVVTIRGVRVAVDAMALARARHCRAASSFVLGL
jgi:hypothetical protein